MDEEDDKKTEDIQEMGAPNPNVPKTPQPEMGAPNPNVDKPPQPDVEMGAPNPNIPDVQPEKDVEMGAPNPYAGDNQPTDDTIPADETELVKGDSEFSDEKNALIIYIQTIIDDFSSYFMVKYDEVKKLVSDENDETSSIASK